ncbi:conserved phage C-terminal domain-containing protein [Enterococcus sp. AZ196]|uniref:conserved phage C-terminal domain-containing protein n=1 Tax=Enterococcus sp. AZ196 TaxID=2774659 RepID=UPI003D2B28EC
MQQKLNFVGGNMEKNSIKQESLLSMGYGMIPKLVMKDPNLSAEAKAIYAYLCSYCGAGDTAFPSTELMCHDLAISEKRLQRHMKQLKESNYVHIERKRTVNGFSNNIYTLPKSVSVCFVPVQSLPVHGVPVQNDPTNINSLNINNLKSNSGNKDHMSGNPDSIPYSDIIKYLNEKADRSFKVTNKWKDLIKARWNEGQRYDDFIKVIEIKTSQWLDDPKMSNYLRPETLFSNKFDSYLNEQLKPKKESNSNSPVVF